MPRNVNLGTIETSDLDDIAKSYNEPKVAKSKSIIENASQRITAEAEKIVPTEGKTISWNSDKKRSWKMRLLYFSIGLLAILLGAGIYIVLNAFGGLYNVSSTEVQVDPTCTSNCEVITIDAPQCTGIFCSASELLKTNNKTNFLITGIDTRDNGGKTYNMDTIMLVSYDHSTNIATMISFPRDLQATYINAYGNQETTKINGLYYGTAVDPDTGVVNHNSGMVALKQEIAEITGLPVHYDALITLDGFIDLIDKLGGVDITLSEDYGDVYPEVELSQNYLNNKCIRRNLYFDGIGGPFCEWSYKKGVQHMTGQEALVFARSRIYSSDFDRAARQQMVILALKEKISNSETLFNANNLLNIIVTLKDNIKTSQYTANDILAVMKLRDSYKKAVNIVLSPSLENGQFIAPVEGTTAYNFKDRSFSAIKAYIANIQKNALLYSEKAKIMIFNSKNNFSVDGVDILNFLANDNNLPGAEVNSRVMNVDLTFGIQKLLNGNIEQDTVESESLTTTTSTQTSKQNIYIVDFTSGQKPETMKLIEKTIPGIINITNKIDISKFKKIDNEDIGIYFVEE